VTFKHGSIIYKTWQSRSMWCAKDNEGRMAIGKNEAEALQGIRLLVAGDLEKLKVVSIN
jgi:hypothetical protein